MRFVSTIFLAVTLCLVAGCQSSDPTGENPIVQMSGTWRLVDQNGVPAPSGYYLTCWRRSFTARIPADADSRDFGRAIGAVDRLLALGRQSGIQAQFRDELVTLITEMGERWTFERVPAETLDDLPGSVQVIVQHKRRWPKPPAVPESEPSTQSSAESVLASPLESSSSF